MKHLLLFFSVLIIALSGFVPTGLSQELITSPSEQGSEIEIIDSRNVELFVDKYISEHMEDASTPGLVFLVVKDGKILFQKGYGYANLESKTPVIPDKTLFRVASISKLFTATAIMQLVEQGKINLNDDVNRYLKHFQLDNNYSKPVTIANLLTHTAGFDVNNIGMSAKHHNQLESLEQHLIKRKPTRVLPPGELTVYSNYGIALAGYIVEQVSKIPFAEYVDKNIFKPLAMHRSSFLQPPPGNLNSDLATGYEYKNDQYRILPYTYEHQIPSIALSATATDIGNFMIAHLQNGRYGDGQILQAATTKQMQRQHFTNDPRLPGLAYGFQETFRDNLRIIRHSGLIEGFASRLLLIPQDNLGIFVACNSTYSFDLELVREFLNHFYPIQNKPNISTTYQNVNKSIQHLQGHYLDTITSQKTLAKLFMPYYAKVEVEANGVIVYESQKYIQVEPLLFKSLEGDKLIAFKENDKGEIVYLFDGIFTLRKLTWYEYTLFHKYGFISLSIIFTYACLIQPTYQALIWICKRTKIFKFICKILIHRFFNTNKPTRIMYRTQFLATFISHLNLVFIIIGSLFAFFTYFDWLNLIYGVHPIYVILLCIPVVTSGMNLLLLIYTGLLWKKQDGIFSQRLHYMMVAMASLAFTLFLNYWNLLGFRF